MNPKRVALLLYLVVVIRVFLIKIVVKLKRVPLLCFLFVPLICFLLLLGFDVSLNCYLEGVFVNLKIKDLVIQLQLSISVLPQHQPLLLL